MESDLQHYHHHLTDYHQPQHNQRQMNSGLTRYQSAPSSYFYNILDRDFCQEILNRPSSPETERIIARFLSSGDDAAAGGGDANTEKRQEENLCTATQSSPVKETTVKIEQQTQIMTPMDNQMGLMQQQQQQQANYSTVPQNLYQSQPQQYLANQQPGTAIGGGGGGGKSNLVRHRSTPAGWFSKINMENIAGYGAMRGMGDYGSVKSSNRPPAHPPSGLMPPIAEMGNKNISSENAGFGENRPNNYSSGFPTTSWDESMMISDNMSGIKRLREDDRSLSGVDLDGAEMKNTDEGDHRPTPLLAHHLSLPKSSSDASAIEKLLQYQNSVPCKIRAKRGFATHPRSIAERVRRTKISERMRKLQDLVPNMDKQTNTSDMLDLAVDYIKDLQKQVKTLSDSRAKCSCASQQHQQQQQQQQQ